MFIVGAVVANSYGPTGWYLEDEVVCLTVEEIEKQISYLNLELGIELDDIKVFRLTDADIRVKVEVKLPE